MATKPNALTYNDMRDIYHALCNAPTELVSETTMRRLDCTIKAKAEEQGRERAAARSRIHYMIQANKDKITEIENENTKLQLRLSLI